MRERQARTTSHGIIWVTLNVYPDKTQADCMEYHNSCCDPDKPKRYHVNLAQVRRHQPIASDAHNACVLGRMFRSRYAQMARAVMYQR